MRERTNAAEQEVCHRGIGIISGEAVGAVLEKVIVVIEAGALVRASNREIVTALDQPDSVVPVKRGAREDRIGECAETEKAGDAERFDRLVRRLINVLDAEVAHVGRVRRRVAAGALARHGEAEIVEQPRAENVGFLKGCVIGPVRSLIGVGEKVIVRQDSRLQVPGFVEPVVQAIVCRGAVVDARNEFVEALKTPAQSGLPG